MTFKTDKKDYYTYYYSTSTNINHYHMNRKTFPNSESAENEKRSTVKATYYNGNNFVNLSAYWN